jgi:hypothetical protein
VRKCLSQWLTVYDLAKVGVEGSNPFARSKFLDLIEGSHLTTLRAGRPGWRAACAYHPEKACPRTGSEGGNRFSDTIIRKPLSRTLP